MDLPRAQAWGDRWPGWGRGAGPRETPGSWGSSLGVGLQGRAGCQVGRGCSPTKGTNKSTLLQVRGRQTDRQVSGGHPSSPAVSGLWRSWRSGRLGRGHRSVKGRDKTGLAGGWESSLGPLLRPKGQPGARGVRVESDPSGAYGVWGEASVPSTMMGCPSAQQEPWSHSCWALPGLCGNCILRPGC